MSKSVNLEDLMSPEDLKKVSDFRATKEEISNIITKQWAQLSEFGVHFGWDAIMSVLNDDITIDQMNMLILGARKVHSTKVYDNAKAQLAVVSGRFYDQMKPYIDDMNGVK